MSSKPSPPQPGDTFLLTRSEMAGLILALEAGMRRAEKYEELNYKPDAQLARDASQMSAYYRSMRDRWEQAQRARTPTRRTT